MTVKKLKSEEGQSDRVAKRAYQFFLQEGCQHGSDVDHWLRAEKEVSEELEIEEQTVK